MKCEHCSEPATVHITDTSRGKYRVLHLCGKCADKETGAGQKHSKQTVAAKQEKLLKVLLATFGGAQTSELAELTCPCCGTRYMEFRTKGRLGCAAEYDAFQKGLLPLLERIHGAVKHVGKCPRGRSLAASGQSVELMRIRRALGEAIEREDFELAAQLRDAIREIRSGDQPE